MIKRSVIIISGMTAVLFSISLAASPADLYKKCAGCHGEDGKHKAFDRSDIIAGKSKDELLKKLISFQNISSEATGTSKVMNKQLKNLSKEELEELADYISKL